MGLIGQLITGGLQAQDAESELKESFHEKLQSRLRLGWFWGCPRPKLTHWLVVWNIWIIFPFIGNSHPIFPHNIYI